ncbi:MAG TPA: OmpH family outer membrane protein [Lacunisphaera sp.]|jgi:outer membrane protein
MNKTIRTLITLAAIAAGSTTLLAQPAVKLVVVDMAKAYDGYYKSEDGNAKLHDAEKMAQEQVEELNKQGQILVDEYKELVEQSKSTVLTQEARTKAEGEAQKKMEEIQQKQASVQDFTTKTRGSLQQRMKNLRDALLEEITKVVNDIAKRKGATLALDKSGPTLFGIPGVLYADSSYDITDDVLKEINKDRPAPPTSAAGTTPPAASAAPSFSVPNVGGAKTEPKK